MKYLEQLLALKIFRFEDVERLTGNVSTAKGVLQGYKAKGYIKSLRHNLYAAIDLASKNILPNRYEIGSNITDTSYVSYHSAMEFHGYANQTFFEMYISSVGKFKPFSDSSVTYNYCSSKIAEGVFTPTTAPLVKVTDVERTVIDCIDDIEKCGGLEELVECLSAIPYLDELKLLQYLNEYNKIYLYQKAGFVLEYFKEALKLSKSFLDICESKINNSKRYLLKDEPEQIYFSKWKLIAPENILRLTNQGGGELV